MSRHEDYMKILMEKERAGKEAYSGNVVDMDGTPPGPIYDDSLLVRITYPNGSGGTITARYSALPTRRMGPSEPRLTRDLRERISSSP